MRYKWLLLDADGTLFDYDRAEATALQRAFEQFGHEFQPAYAVAYRRINHEIWLQFEQGKISQERLRTRRFELLFEALHIESDHVRFSATYIQNLAEAFVCLGKEGGLENGRLIFKRDKLHRIAIVSAHFLASDGPGSQVHSTTNVLVELIGCHNLWPAGSDFASVDSQRVN